MRVAGEGSARRRGRKVSVRVKMGHSHAPGAQKPIGRTAVWSRTGARAVSLVPGLCAWFDAWSCVQLCVLTASDARSCAPMARLCALLRLPK